MANNTLFSYFQEQTDVSKDPFVQEVLKDYWICCVSREASLLARKEVLTGKAKFGIIGDGKEVPQVAMARAFKKGDFRSGYYRDQTFMFAIGLCSIEDFFAQLYADVDNDPFSGGRQMNSHFASPLIDKQGNWMDHKSMYNVSADISCTGGQMARGLGLALASKLYRSNEKLNSTTNFSTNGEEVSFITIGDASTSEGVFWESINAAGVMNVPMVVSVWDDGYGISVPTELQTTKGSISDVLKGFQTDGTSKGIDIYIVKGWDYPALVETYEKAIEKSRKTHIPAVIHIQELTQPQGHSTSGSHERYKSTERLAWEKDNDCIKKFTEWIIETGLATSLELEEIASKAKELVKEKRNIAWSNYITPVKQNRSELHDILHGLIENNIGNQQRLSHLFEELNVKLELQFSEVVKIGRNISLAVKHIDNDWTVRLAQWIENAYKIAEKFHTHLYSNDEKSALKIPIIPAKYNENAEILNGYEVINSYFDTILNNNPEVYAFGEDVGKIGDVNQGFMGLQAKYGEDRVFDAGIREWTIMGQALGMAMRGLRPIAEIQYLDYLIYGLEPLSDDVATLRYRSYGQQQAPLIIRTRGHRLEGIWHAGSPMGMLLNSLKGMYVCVPRNMTQAAGMYNTLLKSNDPGLVIECLNGYRLKESKPSNLAEFTVPFGVPEVLQTGTDITLVSYGSTLRLVAEAVEYLKELNIHAELIDIQTLIPFDLEHVIVQSLKKTNRILFIDEDFPGGATAYMMQEVLEKQGGYQYLDTKPQTLTAYEHRTPFGSDGDYFSKPNREDIIEKVLKMMEE
jgi:pyruvate/2-oxoglutarate/acetoin dehydrogenase E1 component/TPP-dependent pyruvate/acetoin dehydrogenase alpha subunit